MKRHIGLTPVPDDVNIEKFLEQLVQQHREEMEKFLKELQKTLEETENSGQPAVFTYGKMINYLAKEKSVTEAWLIGVFAAAMWEIL